MNNLLCVNSTIKVNLFDDASFFYFSHFCYVDKIKLYKFPLLRYCRYHHINVWATQKIYNVVKKRWAKFSSLISLLSHHQVTHCCAIKLRKNEELSELRFLCLNLKVIQKLNGRDLSWHTWEFFLKFYKLLWNFYKMVEYAMNVDFSINF